MLSFPDINIEFPDQAIMDLSSPNEIVIPLKEIIMIYKDPFYNEINFFHDADNEIGFTREELVRKICNDYKKMYTEDFIPHMKKRRNISTLKLRSVYLREGRCSYAAEIVYF